ncbi:MAG: outer membrane lipoprotein carrier protein LolA [Deltaproteobacteria bacterium]|nr:outer membrane lipoprotein carrier protein LolA [Deltaproteobacteria bacterium]
MKKVIFPSLVRDYFLPSWRFRGNMGIIKTMTLFICFWVLFSVGVSVADDFETLRQSAQNIKSLSADFVQEKHLKILANPITSKGRLYFKAPRSIRWEYLTPIKSLTLMNDNGVAVYSWLEDKWVLDRAQSDARGIVMDEINNWFSGRFDENPAFSHTVKPGPKPLVILTPKEGVKNFISLIVLTLSDANGLVTGVEIFESGDNRTTIDFINEKLNTDFPESLFEEP